MTSAQLTATKNCYSVVGGPPPIVPTDHGSPAGHHLLPGTSQECEDLMAEASWLTFLEELDLYIAEHGHAAVPQATTTRNVNGKPYPLGRKVNVTRSRYRAEKLDADRAAQLQERPGWEWDAELARWQQKLGQVRAYYDEHHSLNGIPTALRQWVLRQRWQAKKDKENVKEKGVLSPEQVKQLAEIPGILSTEPLDDFVGAAHRWLEQNPGKTMADLQARERVDTANHHGYPVGKKVIYYRRRRAGLDGTHPLPDVDAARLEQLPGWSWVGPRSEDR